MLVRFTKRTIVEGTIYEAGAEEDIANDLADQVVREGNGEVVGLGARSNEVYAQTNATTGATELLGPDGVIPLTHLDITHLTLTSDTGGLADSVDITWQSVVRDDTGITVGPDTPFVTYPTRIYIPNTVKLIRVSAAVRYAYVGATPSGTYRGFNLSCVLNDTPTATQGLAKVTAPVLNIGTTSEGVLYFTSSLIDVSTAAWQAGANYLLMKTAHDSTPATVLKGGATGPTHFKVEMYS